MLVISNSDDFPAIKAFINDKSSSHFDDGVNPGQGAHGRNFSKHWLYRLLKSNSSAFVEAKKLLLSEMNEIETGWETSEIKDRLITLRDMLTLHEREYAPLFFLIILKRMGHRITLLPAFTGEYQDYSRRQEPVWSRSQILKMTGEDELEKGTIFDEHSKILQSGLIDQSYFDRISISEELYYYFTLHDYTVSKLHKLEERNGPIFDLDSFSIDPDQLKLLKKLAISKGPKIILFTGESGAGKTELGRSLAAFAGKKALFVPESKPNRYGNGMNDRMISLSIAVLTSNRDQEFIILDEADELIATKLEPWLMMNQANTSKKEILNELLSKNISNLIIISNTNLADPSTLRRASLVIRFDKLDKKQRISMLNTTLGQFGARELITAEELNFLAEKKEISQGILSRAVTDSMDCSSNPAEQKEIFFSLIHSRLVYLNSRRSDKRISLTLDDL
jgi:hypothetical protein